MSVYFRVRHHPNSCFRGSSAPRFLCHRLSLWPSKLCLNSSPNKIQWCVTFFLPLKLIFLVTSPVFDGHISHIRMVVPSAWSCLAWKTHGWPDMSTVSEWISSGSRWFSWENLQETMVLTLKCGSQECFLFPSSKSGTKLLISRRWSQSPFQSVDLPWWFLCGSWSSFMGHIDMFVGLSGTPKSHESSSCSMKLLQIRYQLFLSISGKT